jgi:hypothetical protein
MTEWVPVNRDVKQRHRELLRLDDGRAYHAVCHPDAGGRWHLIAFNPDGSERDIGRESWLTTRDELRRVVEEIESER